MTNIKTFWLEWKWSIVWSAVIILVAAGLEFFFGRIWICKCGFVLPWYGFIYGSGNSQHISDWYTFSHIIHGMLFYGLLWLVARRLPVRTRFMLAILIECAWEVLENSPLVIDRYRTVTSAFDYVGDSILNSFFDIVAAGIGFFLANKLRVRTIVVAIIAMEFFTGFMVRDNLTFNIIMLIYPVDAIKEWQLKADFVPEELRIKE